MPIANHMERPIRPNSGQWPDTIMQYAKDFREPRNESVPSHPLYELDVSVITHGKPIYRERDSQESLKAAINVPQNTRTFQHGHYTITEQRASV